MNPQTMRCVKLSGRVGQQLLRYGAGPAPALATGHGGGHGVAGAFGVTHAPAHTFWNRPAPAAAAYAGGAPALQVPCGPGQNRNPSTGRCIRIGGRTYKKIHPAAPAPPPLPPPPPPPPAPLAVPKATAAVRRTSSEPSPVLPVGTAEPAPLADLASTQAWITGNCKNKKDPISGLAWTDADTTQLQEVIRLHDRTCVMATGLHSTVHAQHRTGTPATIPGEPATALTLDDFKALRATMRRRNPAYKLPARSHQPAPATWQLYVASDNRSGPDFASVMIVDVAKARATPTGFQYPPESVMIDLGFIPTEAPAGSLCQPQFLVDVLDRLAKANRLLEPVAGGWKPVFTPRPKAYWATERKERVSRLCRDLTRALTTPL